MLRWIVGAGMRFRLLVVAIAAGLVALGVIDLRDSELDGVPEFSPPAVEIQTEALGLSATEVEQMITVPLEADLLNGVAFLDEIHSTSVSGMSSIVMRFEPGTNVYRARQLVQERLTQAHALPNVSKPPVMLEPLSSASRVMVIGMSSEKLSLIEQSVLARWTIRPRLMGVPGVANVSVFGQRERQLQVQVDPGRLREKGVSLADVISTTGNAMWVSPLTFLESSTPGLGGFIDTPNQRFSVRNVSPIVDAGSLGQVAVEDKPGLRLADVADVVEDHQPLIGDGLNGGRGGGASGLMFVVEKYPEANTLEVTRDVDEALEGLGPAIAGVRMDTGAYRPASFVEQATSNIGRTLLIGLVLAAVLIGLLSSSRRTALIAVLTVPVAVAAAGLVLEQFDLGYNLLMVTGLVAGLLLVVDDAVTDSQAITRAARRPPAPGESRAMAIAAASSRTRASALCAAVVVLLALAPLLFLPAGPRAFVAPLVLGFLAAVLVAAVVTLVLTPALCFLLLRPGTDTGGGHGETGESRPVTALRRRYLARTTELAERPSTAVVIGLAVALLGLAVLPLLRTSLTPTLHESDLLVELDASAGLSRPEMSRVASSMAGELRSVPGVAAVSGHVGRAVLSDQVGDVDAGQLWVKIDPSATREDTAAAVEDVVGGYPGLRARVTTFLGERSRELLASSADDEVRVRLYGENADVLAAKAEEVRALLGTVTGLTDAVVHAAPVRPTMTIQVDLAAAQRVGIKPGDVRRTTATLVAGIEVGSLFDRQKVFEVMVWGAPSVRGSVDSVRNMLIETPSGQQVRLDDVADVAVVPTASAIQREAVSRYLDVTATVSDRGYAAAAADVREKLAAVAFPFEHHAELVGGPADRNTSDTLLAGVAVIAVIGIALLLQAVLGSWVLAGLSLGAMLAALSGGLVAALFDGRVVHLGTLAGLVVVLLLAARMVIGLIRHYQARAAEGQPGAGLVWRGTADRLGPIVTSTAAIAALALPFAVAGTAPGLELIHPMAVTVLGGLVSTLVVALLVVPALFVLAGSPSRHPEEAQPPDPVGQDSAAMPTAAEGASR